MSKLKKFIVDKNGQWAHPGQPTMIPDANGRITMQGVPYPVYGIDDQGNAMMMMPGGEYQFPGNNVYEIPMAQSGGDPSIPDLSNRGWLSKYQSGGGVEPIYVTDKNDPRLRAYQDSLLIYNAGEKGYALYNKYKPLQYNSQLVNANTNTKRVPEEAINAIYNSDFDKALKNLNWPATINKIGIVGNVWTSNGNDYTPFRYKKPTQPVVYKKSNYEQGLQLMTELGKIYDQQSIIDKDAYDPNWRKTDWGKEYLKSKKNDYSNQYKQSYKKGKLISLDGNEGAIYGGKSKNLLSLDEVIEDYDKKIKEYSSYSQDNIYGRELQLYKRVKDIYVKAKKLGLKPTSSFIQAELPPLFIFNEDEKPTENNQSKSDLKIESLKSKTAKLPITGNQGLVPSKKLQMQEGLVPVKETYYANFNPSHPDAGKVIMYYDPKKKQYLKEPELELKKKGGSTTKNQYINNVPLKPASWLNKYQ